MTDVRVRRTPPESPPGSADIPALHHVDDPEQDHGADEGNDQPGQRKFLHTAADAEQWSGNRIADQRADAADNDIPENAHRGITVHHLAGEPAGDAAHDENGGEGETK